MAEQTTLLDLPDQGIVIPADPAGVSTGERLRRQSPETYALIVAGLAEGMSTSALHRATGVHRDTIRAVRFGPDHAGAIGQAKERARRNLARVVDGLSERLAEEIDHFAVRDLPLALGICIDKLQLLDGAPTSIVERRDGPSHDDLNAWIAQMKPAQPVSGDGEGGKRLEAARVPAAVGCIESASVVSAATSEEGG